MTNYYPRLTQATTDSEVIHLWLSRKRLATQNSYATVVRQFYRFIGDKGLVDVVLEDILMWVESLELRQFSPFTINQRIAAIRSLFSFACKCGYLQFNVASRVKTSTPTSSLHERILEQEEVKALIEATKNERDRLLLTLLYATGLRVSEVCNLNWSGMKPRSAGGQASVIGKGGKARTVLISPSLWEQLMGLERSHKTEAVFVSQTGRRLERTMVHKIIKVAAERAGINSHVSAHWLRHAHACHSLENGCDIDVLMRSLGHSSLTVTSKYLHARPNEGLIQTSMKEVDNFNYPAIVILGDPHNYCRHGFRNCKDYNISARDGKYPLGQLVHIFDENIIKNGSWEYFYSDVYNINLEEVEKFEQNFSKKEKKHQHSQDLFKMMIRAYIE